MSSIELAWAAGFFDGEGCTTFNPHKGRIIKMCVEQVDRENLVRFKAAIEYGNISEPRNYPSRPNASPLSIWSCSKVSSIRVIMRALWPYLGTTKKRQYITVLRQYVRIGIKMRQNHTHGPMASYVLGIRSQRPSPQANPVIC